jgi:hypothetical protein
MQAWIVKHKGFEGVYLLGIDGGKAIFGARPDFWWSRGLAQLAAERSGRPEDWQVVEVEITEK